jgi:hypothetical protein
VPELQLHWTIQLPVMNTRPFRTIYWKCYSASPVI